MDELCERLDCLPLALELAAARTKLLARATLLARLATRLDLPAPRDADPRHATLNATIAWSRRRTLRPRCGPQRGGRSAARSRSSATPGAARPAYETSLALYEELQDEGGVAHMRCRIGVNAVNRRDLAVGRPAIEQSLADFRRLGSRSGEAQALSYLGAMADLEGDLETAVGFHSQSLAIVQELTGDGGSSSRR